MAKRFIDTGLFDDSWFMSLSKDGKIAWIFLLTKCDHAGIIEINSRLFKVQTGIKSFEIVKEELGNRLISLRDNYFFIPKFIHYQYPNFPQSNVAQQKGAIKRLLEFNLFDEKNLTLKEELNNSYGYGNEYGNEYGKEGGMGGDLKTWRNDFETYLVEMNEVFDSLISDEKYIKQQEKFHPGIDIKLSLEKSKTNFWGTEAGWKYKKNKRSKEIDWKSTFTNAIDLNKVYKPKDDGYVKKTEQREVALIGLK